MGLVHRVLDASILFSFDRTGYVRHAASFEPLRPTKGQVLVTGGTRGIGAAAVAVLRELGAGVTVWARSSSPSVDLGDLEGVAAAAYALQGPLHAVVLNAGAMPMQRRLTAQGHELVWASQVLGHLLLLRVLKQRSVLVPGARVVWVSSGGAYTSRLDLRDLRREGGYQRHSVYANAKRAQLILARRLQGIWPDLQLASMHPGWVDTTGVAAGMPVFYRLTRPLLRTPNQGADTIAWLVSTADPPQGGFYFDRQLQPEHLRASTRSRPGDEEALMEEVFAATEPYLSSSHPQV